MDISQVVSKMRSKMNFSWGLSPQFRTLVGKCRINSNMGPVGETHLEQEMKRLCIILSFVMSGLFASAMTFDGTVGFGGRKGCSITEAISILQAELKRSGMGASAIIKMEAHHYEDGRNWIGRVLVTNEQLVRPNLYWFQINAAHLVEIKKLDNKSGSEVKNLHPNLSPEDVLYIADKFGGREDRVFRISCDEPEGPQEDCKWQVHWENEGDEVLDKGWVVIRNQPFSQKNDDWRLWVLDDKESSLLRIYKKNLSLLNSGTLCYESGSASNIIQSVSVRIGGKKNSARHALTIVTWYDAFEPSSNCRLLRLYEDSSDRYYDLMAATNVLSLCDSRGVNLLQMADYGFGIPIEMVGRRNSIEVISDEHGLLIYLNRWQIYPSIETRLKLPNEAAIKRLDIPCDEAGSKVLEVRKFDRSMYEPIMLHKCPIGPTRILVRKIKELDVLCKKRLCK